jgi:hypothetical protein
VNPRPPSDNDTPPPGTDMRKVAEAGLDNLAEIDRLARADRIQRAKFYELAKRPAKGLRFDESSNGHVSAAPTPYALALDDFIAAKLDGSAPLIGTRGDNILPSGGLFICVGKGGKGKTTLAIDMAFNTASGLPWLDMPVARPLRILIIENEGPQEPFREKLERKRENWPHAITGGLFVKTLDWGAFRIDGEGEATRLRKFIEDERIDLVIGDPLSSMGMKGVGSPENTRDFMAQLVEVGLTRDVAFWLLHHPRKEEAEEEIDEASGDWGGKPDTMCKLSVLADTRSRLSFSKVRWSAVANRPAYILSFDSDTESFSVAGREKEDEIRDLVAEITALFRDGRWRTITEIRASRQANPPGIGANQVFVQEALDSHPDLFVKSPGKDVGRNPRAVCYQLQATYSEFSSKSSKSTFEPPVEGPTYSGLPPKGGKGPGVSGGPPGIDRRGASSKSSQNDEVEA